MGIDYCAQRCIVDQTPKKKCSVCDRFTTPRDVRVGVQTTDCNEAVACWRSEAAETRVRPIEPMANGLLVVGVVDCGKLVRGEGEGHWPSDVTTAHGLPADCIANPHAFKLLVTMYNVKYKRWSNTSVWYMFTTSVSKNKEFPKERFSQKE